MNAKSVATFLWWPRLVWFQHLMPAFLACFCITVGQPSANAAIIASETFAYNTGADLAGNNGGTGWAAAWTASENAITKATVIDSSANPLSFTPAGGSTIAGGNQALQIQRVGGTTATNHRAGARQLASPLQKTFYAGYLFRYDGDEFGGSNNTFTMHLSNADNNNTSINFGVRGNTPGSATTPPAILNEFIVRSGTGAPLTAAFGGGDLVNGKEYFLLAKLTYSGTNYDQVDVWIDPAVNPGAPNLTLSLTAGTGLSQISHLFFRRAADEEADLYVADGIVLADTAADILGVPEPSGMALLLGAGMGLFGGKLRRRA